MKKLLKSPLVSPKKVDMDLEPDIPSPLKWKGKNSLKLKAVELPPFEQDLTEADIEAFDRNPEIARIALARWKDYKTGLVKPIDGDEVMQRVRSRFGL